MSVTLNAKVLTGPEGPVLRAQILRDNLDIKLLSPIDRPGQIESALKSIEHFAQAQIPEPQRSQITHCLQMQLGVA